MGRVTRPVIVTVEATVQPVTDQQRVAAWESQTIKGREATQQPTPKVPQQQMRELMRARVIIRVLQLELVIQLPSLTHSSSQPAQREVVQILSPLQQVKNVNVIAASIGHQLISARHSAVETVEHIS